jgi:hypothetical protein
MNRKLTLLLIAAVTTILPAVAVADVMITGQISLESMHHHTAFEFQPGPNYPAANSTDSIGWMPTDGNTMGMLDLQGSLLVTTQMVNVIDLNITVSNAAAPASFMGLYLNVSSSTFPVGTVMVISTSMIGFSALTGTAVTHYVGTPISVDASSLATVVAVDLSENPHMVLTGFSPTETFYFGFILPPGYYAGAGALLTGQFVAFS